jgi:hypothetical protein
MVLIKKDVSWRYSSWHSMRDSVGRGVLSPPREPGAARDVRTAVALVAVRAPRGEQGGQDGAAPDRPVGDGIATHL